MKSISKVDDSEALTDPALLTTVELLRSTGLTEILLDPATLTTVRLLRAPLNAMDLPSEES